MNINIKTAKQEQNLSGDIINMITFSMQSSFPTRFFFKLEAGKGCHNDL